MLVFAKVKYLITFADTFYFSWLQVMGNYLVYGRVFRSTTLATTWQHHQSLCLFLLYITREFPKTLRKIEFHEGVHWTSSSNVLLAQPVLLTGGGGGELLGILGGGVPPGSSNPVPISNQKYHFHTSFQTWPLKSIPILRPAFKKLCHHY